MRALPELFLLAILVLSLSIIAQPKPGLCTAEQTSDVALYGEIAIPGKNAKFESASMGFINGPSNSGSNLFTGQLNISSVSYKKSFDYTAYMNAAGDVYVTTTGNATVYMSAVDGVAILQIPGDGISGFFDSTTPPPE